ncbi:MAG: response regulator [Chloroflexaceae bacterium]|nr:response regulator [Chloroflexaceae bacterium]
MSERPYILLVEDSPSQALQLRLMLQTFTDYDISVISDGAEGWRQACTRHPTLILLDINLPSLDGFQILSRLKRNRATAHIPVIMLTTSDSVSDVERAIELGANDYLFKDDCLFKSVQARNQLYASVGQYLNHGKEETA